MPKLKASEKSGAFFIKSFEFGFLQFFVSKNVFPIFIQSVFFVGQLNTMILLFVIKFHILAILSYMNIHFLTSITTKVDYTYDFKLISISI
jgi:hypothetical protein